MKSRYLLAIAAAATIGTAALAQDYPWSPDGPISIVVPWAAGGATDQVVRLLASEIEDALGSSVVVVNTPGASGSVGTNTVLQGDHDGYTWASGAAADLGTYPVLGMLDTRLQDWHLYLAVANVAVVSVNASSDIETFDELLEAMESDTFTVATAGLSSAGHNAIELIVGETGADYSHVTYDGGNPAVISTVSGETQMTTQLAAEQAEMIRGGRLRPLAVVSDSSITLDGYGEIPPITNWLPELQVADNYFGIWIPADAPAEVVETMNMIWENHIANSEVLENYALERGTLFRPSFGETAQERAMPIVRTQAWTMYDTGQAEVAPDTVGIERP